MTRPLRSWMFVPGNRQRLDVGETMFPPRIPSFAAATERPLLRSGESAVSPPRATSFRTMTGEGC